MRLGVALALLALLVLVVPRLQDPQTWMLWLAMRELGPIGGWRCVQSPFYVYDPSREESDSALQADPPEALVRERAPDEEIDHVETDLRTGESLVWTNVMSDEGDVDGRRVYVLSPGRIQPVTLEVGDGRLVICNAHLGAWRIVGEHTL